jgi:hypothetical protein
MTAESGILFLHHDLSRAAKTNLASVKKQNPDAVIVTISAGEKFPNGYGIDATPEIQKLHSLNPARSSDWLVCSWFIQRRERCKKWWIIEWDTFCRVSAKNYYRPVWKFPFVASSVRLLHREPEWAWFSQAKNLPEKFKPFAIGAVPFLYLVADRVLKRVCNTLMKHRLTIGNGELRFATVANACGFPPCGFSPPHDGIGWIKHSADAKKLIFHPIKNSSAHVRTTEN